MSAVSVCRSVPSPQSDLYRYPWASTSESIIQRNSSQGHVEEIKMSHPSGTPMFSPSTSASVTKDNALLGPNGNGSGQHTSGSTVTLPQSEVSSQLGPPFSQPAGLGLTLNPVHHAVDGGKDGIVAQQNQDLSGWNSRDGNMTASQPSQTGREPENVGEENCEDLAEEISNGEEDGQMKSPNDADDDKRKTKRFR